MDADGHHHGMDGTAPPPSSSSPSMGMEKVVMHGSFFWGSRAEIVFKNWPAGSTSSSSSSPGMYMLALLFVFVLAFLVEWLSHRGIRLMSDPSNNKTWWVVGVVRTIVHAVRVGLAYVLMLSVMSFNVGVFLVAVAGHALGFFVFGTKKSPPPGYWEGL